MSRSAIYAHNPTQLPSPPTLHAEIPSSPPPGTSHPRLRLRIPSTAKRVRNQQEEEGDDDDMIYERMDGVSEQEHENSTLRAPSTPKRRRRIAPEVLPLGLERSDFHTLRLAEMENPEHEGAFVFSAGVIHSILRVKHEEVGRRKKMPRIGQGRKIEC
ncbi:DNA-binding protein [Botrytis cinerea]